jgi:hypothetical protein
MGYRTQSRDTTYHVERRLVDAWRRMSSQEKARQFLDCCQMVDQLSLAGLRMRHPGVDERELFLRLAALRLGPELMREVYGWTPDAL